MLNLNEVEEKVHSISYTLSRNQAVVVEYVPDEDTDMFQIGRSSEMPIDFVVMDTVPGDKSGSVDKTMQSTISRFACRILVDRKPPHATRLFAAGFDSSRNIFLGDAEDDEDVSGGVGFGGCGSDLDFETRPSSIEHLSRTSTIRPCAIPTDS
ncbi:Protein pellino [Folsomia candida]|uniref:Protein pellino n=1 Tax=Folsomia candida TaxID=158441 RepID=A0A226E589_FOLCA|nr:Protein pellino [Folsomia candida]